MFTWICPVCQGEVPPSYDECPRCAKAAADAAPAPVVTPTGPASPQVQGYAPAPPRGQAAPSSPPQGYAPPAQGHTPPSQGYTPPAQSYAPLAQSYAPLAQSYAPPAPSYAPPAPSYTPPAQHQAPPAQHQAPPAQHQAPPAQAYAPPAQSFAPPAQSPASPAHRFAPAAEAYPIPPETPSTGLRDLAVTVVVAAVLLGGGYFFWTRSEGRAATGATAKTELEPIKGAGGTHPFAKQIEVTGVRLRVPKPGQAEVQLLVVNHSAAEIDNLTIDVVLGGKGTNREVAAFPVKVKTLRPFGSAEVTAKTQTEVKAIDIPDWQFLEAKAAIQSNEP